MFFPWAWTVISILLVAVIFVIIIFLIPRLLNLPLYL